MYIISKHVNTVITLTYRLGPTKMTCVKQFYSYCHC